MNCKLCNQNIKTYNPLFHHLKIDENHEVDICLECMDKIVMWQGSIYAHLFPTKALKKRFEKDK